MKNIELKIKVGNFRKVKKYLKEISAKECGVLIQKDTYYNSKNNRLKIREINDREFQLVGYNRPDEESEKICDYDLLNLKKEQVIILKKILKKSYGEKVIVKKKRELWIYKNTRIHLDSVNMLGNFLELETVVREGMGCGKKEHKEIFDLLRLDSYKKIKKLYSDLITKK